MNSAIISSLRGVAKTKLFAIFAVSFFLILSAIIVILFSSQSFTPSIDQLQSLILKDSKPATQVSNAISQTAVLGATTNANAFLFTSSTQVNPLSYEYDINKSLETMKKNQSSAPAFVLNSSEVEGFMVFITGKLGLNEAQSTTLIKAINAAIEKLDSDYVRISIMTRKTADSTVLQSMTTQKLPTVKDRLFFFVESTQETTFTDAPEVTPIPFKNPLELGVISL